MFVMQMMREVHQLAPPIIHAMVGQWVGPHERDLILAQQDIAVLGYNQLPITEIIFFVDFNSVSLRKGDSRLQSSRPESQFCPLGELHVKFGRRCEAAKDRFVDLPTMISDLASLAGIIGH